MSELSRDALLDNIDACPGEKELLVIGGAARAISLGLGFRERGQEQARENSDDRNHHEQLNECESGTSCARVMHLGNRRNRSFRMAQREFCFSSQDLSGRLR